MPVLGGCRLFEPFDDELKAMFDLLFGRFPFFFAATGQAISADSDPGERHERNVRDARRIRVDACLALELDPQSSDMVLAPLCFESVERPERICHDDERRTDSMSRL